MNQHEQRPEQVYQCWGCGQFYPEDMIVIRPFTKTPYCTWCQSEDLRLVTEEQTQIQETRT